MKRLGMQLAIYSTSLTDTAHVQVVRHHPDNAHEIENLRDTPGYDTTSTKAIGVVMKFDRPGEKAISLIIGEDIQDPAPAESLASGSVVTTTPLADSVALVNFGPHSLRFRYPLPVHTDRILTRIARKSSYIEVRYHIS